MRNEAENAVTRGRKAAQGTRAEVSGSLTRLPWVKGSPAQPIDRNVPEGAAVLAVGLTTVEPHVLPSRIVEAHQRAPFGAYRDGNGELAKESPQACAGRD